MTKKKCPLGEDCDLTLAWMMGAEDARDKTKARTEALTEQLEAARLDAKEAEAYSVWLEAKLAKAEVIVRIIASAEFDERIGEAVDLSCEYLAELEGDKT